ncbi:MAG TPA: hypothetical protein VJ984_04545 [Xanthomonadales bacterium]|nr:hypothetical protein [Xanthomonadales bacterium]
MNREGILAALCGLLTLVIIHYAYWLNIHTPGVLAAVYQCNPYFEGCVSVSRAARSGPGLLWFKLVMLPCALMIAVSWRNVGAWMAGIMPGWEKSRLWTVRLGMVGAVALVFYVIFLGTEGEVYSWLRRYGVVFFFGMTALAQLLVARLVWAAFGVLKGWLASLFVVLVSLQWVTGVFSVLKRLIFDNPDLIDRLENMAEWLMILLMSLGFILMGLFLCNQQTRKPASY